MTWSGRGSAACVDYWTPRARDLPSPRLLRVDPRLVGIEHNPVFRRILHRNRRTRATWWKRLPIPLVTIAVGMIVLHIARLPVAGVVGVGLVLAFLVSLGTGWVEELPEPSVGGLPIRVWADLASAGYPARDLAIGLWATALLRHVRRRPLFLLAGITCVTLGVLVAEMRGDASDPARVFATYGALITTWETTRYEATRLHLANLRSLLLTAAGRPPLQAFRWRERIARSLHPELMPHAIVLLAILGASWFVHWKLMIPVSVLAGATGGLLTRRQTEVDAARNIEELIEEVARILDAARGWTSGELRGNPR